MRSLGLSVLVLLCCGSPAWSHTTDPWLDAFAPRADHDPWRIDWQAAGEADAQAAPVPARLTLSLATSSAEHDGTQPLHAAAIEHSDGYRTRAKIHKYASFAMLPLFAAQLALGQSLYNTPANAGS